jgi:hypothetical protein
MYYDIYVGLGGGFGGAEYVTTEEFDTEEEAMDYAYECACEEYSGYEGLYGIQSWEEIKEELITEYGEDEIADTDVDAVYNDERESWLNYYVKLNLTGEIPKL